MKSIGELVIDLDAGLKTDEQLNLIEIVRRKTKNDRRSIYRLKMQT